MRIVNTELSDRSTQLQEAERGLGGTTAKLELHDANRQTKRLLLGSFTKRASNPGIPVCWVSDHHHHLIHARGADRSRVSRADSTCMCPCAGGGILHGGVTDLRIHMLSHALDMSRPSAIRPQSLKHPWINCPDDADGFPLPCRYRSLNEHGQSVWFLEFTTMEIQTGLW